MAALSITCTSDEFSALYPRTQAWPRTLRRHLRIELRDAARPAAKDAAAAALRLRLTARPPSRHPQRHRSTGLRRGISNSVKLISRDQGAGIEYRIRAGHPMASPTDASSFRHPVFGNRDVWAGQESQLWWTQTMDRHRPRMRDAAGEALRKAVGEL